MASLMEVYEEMQKTAQEQAVVEETPVVENTPAVEAVEGVDAETLKVLEKYAQAAEAYLTENFESHTDDDIVKVAQEMIAYDTDRFETMEKVAELHEAGIIMAKAFKAELASK